MSDNDRYFANIFTILGIKPFSESTTIHRKNIISNNTKAILNDNTRILKQIIESVDVYSEKTLKKFDTKAICLRFIKSAKGGFKQVAAEFYNTREIKGLLVSVFNNFKDNYEESILLNESLLPLVLELFKNNNERKIRRMLLYYLVEYWTEIPADVKSSILQSLLFMIKEIRPENKTLWDRLTEKNFTWMLPNGTKNLATKLKGPIEIPTAPLI